MLRFVVRRLLLLIPILLGLSILVFIWIRALPGGPAQALLGERATQESIEQIERAVRARRAGPRPVLEYVKTVGQGDLGTSVTTRRPVDRRARAALPGDDRARDRGDDLRGHVGDPTRLRRGEELWDAVDHASLVVSLIGISIPGLLPRDPAQVRLRGEARVVTDGRPDLGHDRPRSPDELLPARRSARGRPLGVLGRAQAPDPAGDRARLDPARDHRPHHAGVGPRRPERGLRAHGARKGLSPRVVDQRHIFRNALLPIVTIIGLQAGLLLSGAVLTETVFAFPGMGTWLVDAIKSRNYPVLQGGILFVSLIFVLVNLLVDVAYAFINPRIRVS